MSFLTHVSPSSYNCAGFALGIGEWIRPYEAGDDFFLGKKIPFERQLESAHFLEEMLTRDYDLPIRLLPHKNGLRRDESLVAYRTASTDFHFRRRLPSGVWVEKMGSWSDIETSDSIDTVWGGRYDGHIFFYGIKRTEDVQEYESDIEDVLENFGNNLSDFCD